MQQRLQALRVVGAQRVQCRDRTLLVEIGHAHFGVSSCSFGMSASTMLRNAYRTNAFVTGLGALKLSGCCGLVPSVITAARAITVAGKS